jgi:ABC-2 type transport system ATP-binding protein
MEEAERLADEVVIMDRGRVIARGLPGAIIESLGAESVVEFVATRDGVPVELPEDVLRALPGVRTVRREGAATLLSVGDTRAAVSALFAASDRGAFALEDVRTHRATLEDVFVALTGKHLSP